MIGYFDCFSGISGDMILGALVDAGVSVEDLNKELSRLSVKGYEMKSRKVKRAGFSAIKVDVEIKSKVGSRKPEARKWKDIKSIIETSTFSNKIKQRGLRIFKRLFEAEARVHGGRYNSVHLHELGAVDCLVDIFGTLIGIDILGIETIYSSALNLGSGTIKSEHGLLPVPAPASIELLKEIPVFSSDVSFELTTPTGAALMSSLSSGFGPMPDMNISKTGIGAGRRDFKDRPNILRIFMGEGADEMMTGHSDITVIETNIDDMNPQVYEYVMDKLFKAGALDVYLTRIIMKKGRPGIKLTVLCDDNKKDKIADIIFKETTSIGIRCQKTGRKTLEREIRTAKTKYGKVNVKVSRLENGKEKISVEYEDCKKIAKKFNIPLLEVMKAINS